MIITRSNQETLKWLTQIDWQKMSGKTLTDEAMCFFGELQTKRPNTVKSKLAEFLKKEDQLRKCVLFKIMRERGGEGPRGRSPPSNLELKDITFGEHVEVAVEVVNEVVDEVVEQVVLDVVVVVNVDVDTLGIGTGLSVDDIKDPRGI